MRSGTAKACVGFCTSSWRPAIPGLDQECVVSLQCFRTGTSKLLPVGQIYPAAVFFFVCERSLIGTKPHPFVYILSVAAFKQGQSFLVVTVTGFAAKPKIFTF